MPIHTTEQGWVLETHAAGYALGVNRAGLLAHRYWGARLPYPTRIKLRNEQGRFFGIIRV